MSLSNAQFDAVMRHYDEIREQMMSLYPGAADQAVGSLIGTRM